MSQTLRELTDLGVGHVLTQVELERVMHRHSHALGHVGDRNVLCQALVCVVVCVARCGMCESVGFGCTSAARRTQSQLLACGRLYVHVGEHATRLQLP